MPASPRSYFRRAPRPVTSSFRRAHPLCVAEGRTQARVGAALDRLVASLAGRDADSLGEVDAPAEVRWALDTALFDIEARRRGLPLARLLGSTGLAVPVNAALGALDAAAPERAAACLAQGYGVAKFKVGRADADTELAWLREVAATTGGWLRLRSRNRWPRRRSPRWPHSRRRCPLRWPSTNRCSNSAQTRCWLPAPCAAWC